MADGQPQLQLASLLTSLDICLRATAALLLLPTAGADACTSTSTLSACLYGKWQRRQRFSRLSPARYMCKAQGWCEGLWGQQG